MAAKAAYGANPHAGRNPNANLDWGSYQWPGGVPGNLLGVATIPGPVRVVVRTELVPLVEAAFKYIQLKWGRTFVRGWTGGYENRPISGTTSPSNHSKGKAIDLDAQSNPMSYIWQCDIDPAIISFLESCGFYWGGRYSGKTDPMHIEYCWPKGEVARHLGVANAALAKLGNQPAPNPPAPTPAPTPAPNPTPAPPTPSSSYEAYSSAAPGSRNVKLYSNGDDVKQLQSVLHLSADGKFGPATEAAVKAFQSQHGLSADGIVGPNTWKAILGTDTRIGPAPTSAPAYPGLLKRGSKGNGVKTMQSRLNEHLTGSKQAPIGVDGDFGPATENAVRWYQTARHNAPFNLAIDGEVGPATWKSLWQ
jgi:peptidoglycan hydrolase-like protein with peptidoglycan-binding domain